VLIHLNSLSYGLDHAVRGPSRLWMATSGTRTCLFYVSHNCFCGPPVVSSCWALHTNMPDCFALIFIAAALMTDIYEDHKDEDGFLYITYSGENTFG